MGFLRRGAVAALVLMLAAGCSTKPGSTNSGAGEATPGSGGAAGTGAAGTGFGATGGGTPGGSGTQGPRSSQSVPDDFISAFASDDGSWGCAMKPGELCRVKVQGAYFLKASNAGGIQIVAFENGSTTPAEESVVRPVPAGGSPYNAVFGYRIGRDARTFAIQGYLKDDRGVVVAKSRQQTFQVNRS